MVWFKEFSYHKMKVSSLIKCQASQKRKWQTWLWTTLLLIAFNQLFCCSALFSPTILRQRGFSDLQVEMLLTKSELSFSLEVVSAVSGSVVMVLQITSLTFSWTSAPSTWLSWDTNHRQQYSELTTWKIEVHDCVQFCSVLQWIDHYPHILLHSLNNHEAVILLPLRAASLTNKNPQTRKIIHGMRPVGRKDLLIDLNMHVYL